MGNQVSDLTTDDLAELRRAGRPLIALVAVGSVEPHGPHLPLGTDTVISQAAIRRAAERLEARGWVPLVAPAVPYGVTEFAAGFPGAISVPPAVLEAYLRAVVQGYVDAGVTHVCLVNNHLEPAHDQAVRAAILGFPPGRASVACPLSRRWARTLSDEFKSGACHAGRYETSILLAAAPSLVRETISSGLPAVDVSLSEGIKQGLETFRAMGMTQAYAGAPADATADEGAELIERLATMVFTEIEEASAQGEAWQRAH